MLWNVMKLQINEICDLDEAALIRQCAHYLNLEGRIMPIKEALSTCPTKKEFSRLYDETERSFIATGWMRVVWNIVFERLHKKYPKHRFSKADIDVATSILLVQGLEALFMPVNESNYPCLICHPWCVDEVLMVYYPRICSRTVADREMKKYISLVRENVDFWEVVKIIAEDICEFIFRYHPELEFCKDAGEISPILKNHIDTDAFDILIGIHRSWNRLSKQ